MNPPSDRRTPPGNAPAWTEHAATPLPHGLSAADIAALRLPDEPPAPGPSPFDADHWVTARLGPRVNAWGEPLPPVGQAQEPQHPAELLRAPADLLQLSEQDRSSVAQTRLVAGLLAIFLGGLGAHKFYLGLTAPGLLLLGLSVGTWLMALVLGFLMFIVGLALTLPLALTLSGVLGVFGVVEGLILLGKSDEAFAREYLLERKPWL